MADLVLVVGGHGCVGARVVANLRDAGIEAVAASRSAPSGVRADVLDPSSLASGQMAALRDRVTHVVMAAGSARPGHALDELDVHVRGTASLLAWAALAPRLERLVLVSSVLVYGDARRPRPTGLDLGQRHPTVYGFAKQRSEELLVDSGLPAARVRLGLLVGDSATGELPANQPVAQFARLCLRLPLLPLARGGAFPAWTVAVDRAATDVAAAVLDDHPAPVSISADPASPDLRDLAATLTAPFGRVPLVVDPGDRAMRSWTLKRVLGRAGVEREWLGFARPWADLTAADVAAHQATPAPHAGGVVARTALALRRALLELVP